MGFPGNSAGKESTCNAGDPGLIPGRGRSPGEGIGYPFQYSWVFLVAQTVKKPLAVQETWVWSLGWEDPLEEGVATHSSILAWRIPIDQGAWQATVLEVAKSQTQLATKHTDSWTGFPGGTSDKEHTSQCRIGARHGFDPWFRKIP